MNSILNRWKTALVVLVAGLTGWVGAVQGGTLHPLHTWSCNDAFSESSRAIQVLCAQFLRGRRFQVQDPDELQIVAPENPRSASLRKWRASSRSCTSRLFRWIPHSWSPLPRQCNRPEYPGLPAGHHGFDGGSATRSSARNSESDSRRNRRGKCGTEHHHPRGIRAAQKAQRENSGCFGTEQRYRRKRGPESYYGALGRVMFEAEEFRLQGGLTLLGSRDLGFAALGLRGAYLFSPEENTSPYIGFDVGWEDTPARMRKRTTTSRRKTPRSSKAADFR